MQLVSTKDSSELNNCRPISNFLESLANNQVRVFLSRFSVLNTYQSGFISMHSAISSVTLDVNNIVITMDKKIHCAAVLIDLSNTFNSVSQSLLSQKLCIIRFGSKITSGEELTL